MSDIYKERSYASGDIGFGGKPGIVVVDFQTAFTDPDMPMGGAELIERGVQNTAYSLKSREAPVCRLSAAMSAIAKRSYRTGKWAPFMTLRMARRERSSTSAFSDRVTRAVRKTAPSIFHGTTVLPFMQREGVESMIVTGCVTSGCIRATTIDSFSYGFRTMVPEDCVGDHDPVPHHQNLEDVGRRYADIVDADTCMEYIEDWRKLNR